VSRAASAGGSGSSNGKGGALALDARRANSTAITIAQITSTISTAAIGPK
jgi:hypothetical protein